VALLIAKSFLQRRQESFPDALNLLSMLRELRFSKRLVFPTAASTGLTWRLYTLASNILLDAYYLGRQTPRSAPFGRSTVQARPVAFINCQIIFFIFNLLMIMNIININETRTISFT